MPARTFANMLNNTSENRLDVSCGNGVAGASQLVQQDPVQMTKRNPWCNGSCTNETFACTMGSQLQLPQQDSLGVLLEPTSQDSHDKSCAYTAW